MTDNIMIINQVKLMQEITTNAKLYKATKQRTESHGLAYQTVTS